MSLFHFARANLAFLAAGVLLSSTSSYGQTYFISLFAGEIKESFDLTDGEWGAIYTVGTTLSAVVMIWVGGLTDKFRIRAIAPVVIVGLALACIAMGLTTGPIMLVGVVFALRFFGQGMLSHLSVVAMARWFVARRGMALSISAMGFGVGQAILPLVFVALLTVWHWQTLWFLAAALVLATLPAVSYLLKLERTPQSMAEDAQTGGMQNRHWTRTEMLRHPLFWYMTPLLFGPPAWGTALFFQQVHLTEIKDWSLTSYVALSPLFVTVATLTTFASGWCIDRIGTGRMIPFYLLPFAACFAIMAQATTIGGAAVALVVFALGAGMQATVPGAFWPEYYGTRHVGAIKAASVAIMIFGSAIGPGVTGLLIDFGIDFPSQMWAIVVYFLLAAISAGVGIHRAGPLPRPT